jgi:hypothetical protein
MERGIERPKWDGQKFEDPTAAALFSLLPPELRRLARREFQLGNSATWIIRKSEPRRIVLLTFEQGPLGDMDERDVVVHMGFASGNYCYDGTKCTFEAKGSFLTFDDPSWEEPKE